MNRSLLRIVAVAAFTIPAALGAAVLAADDTDGDGIADAIDTDDDNDGVDDFSDNDPLDPYICEDVDNDGADDCTIGVDQFGPMPDNDPNNDGPDCDADGIVDATDADDDNDGVLDEDDADPCDPDVTEELVAVWALSIHDLNGNGVLDEPTALLEGWTHTAYAADGTMLAAAVTEESNGPFTFAQPGAFLGAFPAGSEITVCETVLSGWTAVAPSANHPVYDQPCLSATLDVYAQGFSFLNDLAPTNEPPVAEAGGPYLIAAGEPVTLDGAASSDPDGDPLTYSWDGGTFNDATSASPAFIAPDEAGIYDVTLTVDDGAGGTATDTTYIVVYDPDGGFVTGGGWIDSPEGSCADLALCSDTAGGRANFGFVAKYKKGKTAPTGQTAFTFDAAGLSFHTTAYDALIVSGSSGSAQYWGTGTIAGEGSYGFKVWTADGDAGGADDTFRIQIRNSDGSVVYDNGVNQPIAGGQITIHLPKHP